jgi:nitrate reductase NapAB chaperone NapD
VANAFLLKYNIENKFVICTIAKTTQLDENKFEIVRRLENIMSSSPIYERIIFNREQMSV